MPYVFLSLSLCLLSLSLCVCLCLHVGDIMSGERNQLKMLISHIREPSRNLTNLSLSISLFLSLHTVNKYPEVKDHHIKTIILFANILSLEECKESTCIPRVRAYTARGILSCKAEVNFGQFVIDVVKGSRKRSYS